MYVVGGVKNIEGLADSEIMSINKEDKTVNPTIPTMHYERWLFGMCSFAGCIFVAGGYNDDDKDGTLDKSEVYSTESCKWIKVSSMNTKRSEFALIYFQSKVWAIGGCSTSDCIDTIESYNLAENKWTTLDTKLLSKRCGHCAVVHNKKIFVIGGFNQVDLSTVEVYSSETNQFSFLSRMSQARASFGCSIFSNNLIVFGGRSKETEVYDIENQVWSKGPNLALSLTHFGYASTN